MIIFILCCIALVASIILLALGLRRGIDEAGEILVGCVLIAIILGGNTIAFTSSFGTAAKADVIKSGLLAEYKSAVHMYADRAVLNISDITKANIMTDFKYQGYQQNIAKMIRDVREIVREHNEILISKQVYKRSLWFDMYITMPESDKIIHIEDK